MLHHGIDEHEHRAGLVERLLDQPDAIPDVPVVRDGQERDQLEVGARGL